MGATDGEVVFVALGDLRYGPQVRRERLDLDHVERLTLVLDECPPIVVQTGTMEVLDGFHRWNAATRLGRETIRAVVVDAVDAEALEIAVKTNLAHGLPLTLGERKSVAQQLVDGTDWSDSRIGEACGLDHKTVGALRPRPTRESPKLDTEPAKPAAKRKGRDEKERPADVDAQRDQRERIATLIADKPNLSDREIATRLVVSPTTVGKVRAALKADESPIPPKLAAVPAPSPEVRAGDVATFWPSKGSWKRDPSITTNGARDFARWMDNNYPRDKDDPAQIVAACPAELAAGAIEAAKCAADFWTRIATALERRGLSAVEAQ